MQGAPAPAAGGAAAAREAPAPASGGAATERAAPPASGGAPLLRAAAGARRVLAGSIEAPAALDRSGWAAWLRVERELPAPAARGTDAPAGERVRIAWEELVPGRPPRFRDGERVLVALEPLPGWSLWRQRLPRRDALAVAERGQAFLRDPDPATIETLARWRALAAEERDGPAGAGALAELVARAATPLAEAAVAELATLPGLATRLGDDGVRALAAALADPGRGEPVRLALLRLAGAQRIAALHPAVAARTEEGPPLAAAAWEALAALDGGLPEATLRRLLTSPDPGVRAVAAARAPGSALEPQAARLARRDPAPEVRAAAVAALAGTRRPEHVELAFEALGDPAPEVRGRAAQALGALGDGVVPRLREIAEGGAGPRTASALAALAFTGPEGRAALRAIARSHPDAATRQLARLYAGEKLDGH